MNGRPSLILRADSIIMGLTCEHDPDIVEALLANAEQMFCFCLTITANRDRINSSRSSVTRVCVRGTE